MIYYLRLIEVRKIRYDILIPILTAYLKSIKLL